MLATHGDSEISRCFGGAPETVVEHDKSIHQNPVEFMIRDHISSHGFEL